MTKTSKRKAILWDNDGVIADTERLFFKVNADFFKELGVDLTPQHFFDLFLQNNCGAWHLLGLPSKEIDVLRTERNRRYNLHLQQAPTLAFPGVEQVLAQLAPRLRMGIVTSSRHEDFSEIHKKHHLLQYFEFVVAEGDYLKSKPAPDPYLIALEKLGLPPTEGLVVEDSPRGLRSATAAGLDCVIVQSELTAGFDFRGAIEVVSTYDELLATLTALC